VQVNGATITEAVTQITWTAQDGGLPPDQFTEFEVSVGTFPDDADQITFPTVQTYSDGEVARWVENVEPGAPEPEHPAPALELASAGDTAHGAHAENAGPGQAADVRPAAATDSSDGVARTLGGFAVALAVAALAWSLLAGRRARG
jgi:uncharacterized protein